MREDVGERFSREVADRAGTVDIWVLISIVSNYELPGPSRDTGRPAPPPQQRESVIGGSNASPRPPQASYRSQDRTAILVNHTTSVYHASRPLSAPASLPITPMDRIHPRGSWVAMSSCSSHELPYQYPCADSPWETSHERLDPLAPWQRGSTV